MEKEINAQIPVERPTGNLVISLKEIESFDGNKDINGIEALIDDAFKSFLTISVENETNRYQISEKKELIAHIFELQKR